MVTVIQEPLDLLKFQGVILSALAVAKITEEIRTLYRSSIFCRRKTEHENINGNKNVAAVRNRILVK